MSEKPREDGDRVEDYESPKAEELPTDETTEVAAGATQTAADFQQSDRDLKTDIALADPEAALAATRDLTVVR